MFDNIRRDVARVTRREPSWVHKVAAVCFNLGLHAVLFYRLGRWLQLHHLGPLAVVSSYVSSVITGAQISPRAAIGGGLRIYHPQGMTIGAGAVLGRDCTLSHGNMVGTLGGTDDRPVIGDRLDAATGAKILGMITLGDNVRVGPNSVVIHSLPSGVTVVGNPARTVLRGSETVPKEVATRPAAEAPEEVVGRLVSLLRRTCEVVTMPSQMDRATGLLGEGIGLDSVEILKLVCAIEEEFDLTIDESQVTAARFKTVGSLATFIHERSAR
jgi:serine O-acetyltransferase